LLTGQLNILITGLQRAGRASLCDLLPIVYSYKICAVFYLKTDIFRSREENAGCLSLTLWLLYENYEARRRIRLL